jgi:hypothetical protein
MMRSITEIRAVCRVFISIFSIALVVNLLVVPVVAEEGLFDSSATNDSYLSLVDDIETDVMGCQTVVNEQYLGGFERQDFQLVNVKIDSKGFMSFNSNNLINFPIKVVIPFDQEIYTTFISEDLAFASELGWVFYADAVDESGNYLGWENIDEHTRHSIFQGVVDDEYTGDCCVKGNGILDRDYGRGNFPIESETALSVYDDGSGLKFLTDGDGEVTSRDMKKRIGRFAAGSEIVFYLNADKVGNSLGAPLIYYNKLWNTELYGACTPDTGSPLWRDHSLGSFYKLFHMGEPAENSTCRAESNWLAKPVLDRLTTLFNIQLSGEYHLPVIFGERYFHMIGRSSERNNNLWVFGFEGGEPKTDQADMDFRDLVFVVDRPNGGTAALNPSQAVKVDRDNAFFSAVDLEVCDYQPAGNCSGQGSLTYFVSLDQGVSWIAVNHWDSSRVFSLNSDGAVVKGLSIDPLATDSGGQDYTCRKRRIDLIEKGHTGDSLLWKVEMMNATLDCSPKVYSAQIDAVTNSNRLLPDTPPVVQTNVIYSGWTETPSIKWKEKSTRGHLTAREIYHPFEPDRTLGEERILWDAGKEMAKINPNHRSIFYPDIETRRVVHENLTDINGQQIYGDGIRKTFKGSLLHYPIQPTSVRIYDGRPENFHDRRPFVLEGSFGGVGSIDYATGKWELIFNQPPMAGVPLMADYTWYSFRGSKETFLPGRLSNEMLGLSDELVWPTGYTYDFSGDGIFDASNLKADANWLVQWVRGYERPGENFIKEWQLSEPGLSGPSLMVPPGYPKWLWGTAISDDERQSYIDFRDAQKERDSILFVGSGQGLLHALDAGNYRYGDNPLTHHIRENRGYFVWEPKDVDSPSYCEYYDGSTCPNYGTGREIWSFIPAGILPLLKNNALKNGDRFSVDISPIISDVFIDSNGDGKRDTWRTVILCTVGAPVRSVFCLDVTDPYDPVFLWERSMSDLNRDGLSPTVVRIGRILHPQSGESMWAAFIASGRMAKMDRYPKVILLDIEDGRIIEEIILDGAADMNEDGYLSDSEVNFNRGEILSGQPAIIDSDNNGYIDRVYVASSRGFIYKVNLPDDAQLQEMGFTQCVINTDYIDSKNQSIPKDLRWQPFYASPTVMIDKRLIDNSETAPLVRIFIGTDGNDNKPLDIEDKLNWNIFFSYIDTNPKGMCEQENHQLDWFVELEEGHRITTSAFGAADRVYFGTTVSGSLNLCATGGQPEGEQGKLHIFDFEGVKIMSGQVGNVNINPLVTDEHLYLMMPYGPRSLGSGVYNNRLGSFNEPMVTVRAWEEVK